MIYSPKNSFFYDFLCLYFYLFLFFVGILEVDILIQLLDLWRILGVGPEITSLLPGVIPEIRKKLFSENSRVFEVTDILTNFNEYFI